MVIDALLFIKLIFLKDKTKLPQFIAAVVSVILYLCMIIYLKENFKIMNLVSFTTGAGFERILLDFTNKSHISNSHSAYFILYTLHMLFFIDKKKII